MTVISVKWPNRMAVGIETAARGSFTVFILISQIEKEAIAELRRVFECQTDYRDIVLDLKDLGVIDRECNVLFIRTLSALGIKDFRSVLLGMLRGVTAPPIDHAEAV